MFSVKSENENYFSDRVTVRIDQYYRHHLKIAANRRLQRHVNKESEQSQDDVNKIRFKYKYCIVRLYRQHFDSKGTKEEIKEKHANVVQCT